MVSDLKVLKEVGYNMVRKHIKVEPALFYQACDQLGLLLIQDMPSLATSWTVGPDGANPPGTPSLAQDIQNEFDRQLIVHIEQLKSYPSIVIWVIYNEGWGQPWEKYDGVHNVSADFILTDLVRKHDPSRLIDSVTGWHDHGAGDFHVSGLFCMRISDALITRRITTITPRHNVEHRGTLPIVHLTTQ